MNRKTYLQPDMTVMAITIANIICNSPVTTVSNNAEIDEEIGTGSDTGRARQYNVWQDEEEEEEGF